MPFIPHTQADIRDMLQVIGVDSKHALFDEIPAALLHQNALDGLPTGLSEMALTRLMRERANLDSNLLCFIGAGAYEHFIPAAVWEVATRGEYMTAYTPYQAEASQGTLQLIYEYQTMMARLMAMDVSNASLYDGASALAEAILMAVRLAKNNQHIILMPRTVHPHYQQVVRTIVKQQGIQLLEVPYDPTTGQINQTALHQLYTSHQDDIAGLVIAQPNFFGVLEEIDALTDFAREKKIISIALVNPLAMAWLKPPGEWGQTGVDLTCGEGQPLGIPLASGGPYYGFLCCKKQHIRQMPGRIVGRTVDLNGQQGFVLTLQAREQHIRRAKATSNICTNQGLMVTASTIYMSLIGPDRLRNAAMQCHAHTQTMQQALTSLAGVMPVFKAPYFHEIVVKLNQPAEKVLNALAEQRIQAGIALESYYPELKDCVLLCATETKTIADIHLLSQRIGEALGSKMVCPT